MRVRPGQRLVPHNASAAADFVAVSQRQRTSDQTTEPYELHRIEPGWGDEPLAVQALLTQAAAQAPAANSATAAAADPTTAAAANVDPDGDLHVDNDESTSEVFESYVPEWTTKQHIGRLPHPDPLVETTSLSATSAPQPRFPLLDSVGTLCAEKLSRAQLESVLLACEAHQKFLPNRYRAGFCLGDGAGVGKGRQIAAMILDSWLRGRKRAIWVSVSADLLEDARRDLTDLGAPKIAVRSLTEFNVNDAIDGGRKPMKKGVLFVTYAALRGVGKAAGGAKVTRLEQIIAWWRGTGGKGTDTYDGCIVFDEAHKAKNLAATPPTQVGRAVESLQNTLRCARIVYASATGASEAAHMCYMTRLGLWGDKCDFADFRSFLKFVEKRGVGCMELVASELKGRGNYIARTLSNSTATFRTDRLKLSAADHAAWDAGNARTHYVGRSQSCMVENGFMQIICRGAAAGPRRRLHRGHGHVRQRLAPAELHAAARLHARAARGAERALRRELRGRR